MALERRANAPPTTTSPIKQHIDGANFEVQVNWLHISHDKRVELLKTPKSINDTLQLVGKAIVEEFTLDEYWLLKCQ
jgi:hypothetical protein